MSAIYIIIIAITVLFTLYFVIKSVDFRKFLAGAFFVSGGVQLYLAYMKVSIPVIGTDIVQDAALGYIRGTVHLILCLVCVYFGFIKPKKMKDKN